MPDSEGWGMNHFPDERVASPERLAYEAYERGDRWFQIDVTISGVVGRAMVGTVATKWVRGDGGDIIGPIEQQGWDLQHVSTSFVQTGSTSTKRVLANVGSTVVATHGEVVALYVFKRGVRTQ